MSKAIDDEVGAPERVGDDIRKSIQDDDPQTLLYINPVSISSKAQSTLHSDHEDIFVTLYSWATKIEHTVQANLGKGTDEERHQIEASWERGCYRAKLIDFLAKQTPWLMVQRNNTSSINADITGEYYHDKKILRGVIHDFLQNQILEVPVEKLGFVETYLTETMISGQSSMAKAIRLALAVPFSRPGGPVSQDNLRLLTIMSENDREALTLTVYEGGLNKKQFEKGAGNFDEKDLALGKALVLKATVDIII